MYGTPKKQRIGISFNSPVILGFAAVCVIAQILNLFIIRNNALFTDSTFLNSHDFRHCPRPHD